MSDSIKLYGAFTKKDNDKKIVEGFASTEAVDSQGEVVKVSALKKALPKYMTYANLREMHQWSAVGKAISAKIDDKKKGLYIKGKIVDKDAWAKVKEGVYNGFSIGGKVAKKIGNTIHELVLNEISLVDRPANPEAVFSLVKIKKGGEVVEKQLPIAPYGMTDDEIKYPGIKIADQLIAMSSSITRLIESCGVMKRPTKHIEKVLSYLKKAAMFELQSEKQAITARIQKDKLEKTKQGKELKDLLSKTLANRIINPGWVGNYFETHKEVL